MYNKILLKKNTVHKTVTIICILEFDENHKTVSNFCIISFFFPEIFDPTPPLKSYNVSKRQNLLSYCLFAEPRAYALGG